MEPLDREIPGSGHLLLGTERNSKTVVPALVLIVLIQDKYVNPLKNLAILNIIPQISVLFHFE